MNPRLYTFNEYSVMRGPTCPDTGYSEDYVLLADCEELPKDALVLTREQVEKAWADVEWLHIAPSFELMLDELFGEDKV